MSKVIVGGEYELYDGHRYQVISLGHRVRGRGTKERVLEQVVIYQALYASAIYGKDAVWVREVGDFLNDVKFEGRRKRRFRFAGMASRF